MKGILQNLLRLQGLEFGEHAPDASQAAELRAAIPQPMLSHYDRLRARGKKGIAVVRHQVCASCRMQVPIAVVATLLRGTVIQACGNCGRYLCLPEPEEAQEARAVEPVATAKSAPKSRGRPRRVAALKP